jgi:antitoxin (DNA-binding transcriptional repressor) of toxin-antitoxin stability system
MKMPSITLSQLRDTRRLRAWLRAGKTVELRERSRVIAHIVPVKEDDGPRAQGSSGGNPSRKLKRAIDKILQRVDRLPVLDDRSPDEIIGYDKDGLPAALRKRSGLLFTFGMRKILRTGTQGGTILEV